MTTPKIGPSFYNDLIAAGLTGLPFSWTPEGVDLSDPALTKKQIADIQKVVAAHDPTKPDPVIIKAECSRRIAERFSSVAQMNLTAYIGDLTNKLASGDELTAEEQADIKMARAIREWVAGPQGMLETSRALVSGGASDFTSDSSWPKWETKWVAFIKRF